MKKILFGITTLGVMVAPVAALVACGEAVKKDNPQTHKNPENSGNEKPVKGNNGNSGIGKNIGKTSSGNNGDGTNSQKATITNNGAKPEISIPMTNQFPATKLPVSQPIKVVTQVPWTLATTPSTPIIKPGAKTLSAVDKAMTTFSVSVVTENPNIGYLSDVDDTPREFKVFDNGLFKIKIQTSLIGPGRYYADDSKAELQAWTVANSINIGPAIKHIEKGIQILESNSPASLGGQVGVQISVTNINGTANDEGIRNNASLIDHEYGHHETMWDFENMLNGSVDEATAGSRKTMREVMVQGLKNAGYDKISELTNSSNPINEKDLSFMPSVDSDFPSDYGKISAGQHQIFGVPDYPFSAPEIATRMLNILSCRTDLPPQDLYEAGKAGHFPTVGGRTITFDEPAAFVSDATIRHFAQDSVFGGGKDNSRVQALIKFYEKKIFGYGSSAIGLIGDPDNQVLKAITLSSFGVVNDLDTLEVQDASGKVIASQKVESFKSRMGFKNELISSDWSTKLNATISNVDNFTLNLNGVASGNLKIFGKDANGKVVDISKLTPTNVLSVDKTMMFNATGIVVEGNHLSITI